MVKFCGISGFIKINLTNEEAYQLASTILLEQESRGKDATGIYTNNNFPQIIKAPLEATNFIKYLPKEYGTVTLLHNRSGTSGTEWNNNNNHPIFSKNWVLIHNGIVRDMERLKDYPYMGEVDSEIILSYIETKGIPEALTKIEGSAALAFTKQNSKSIYLWRNSSPIKLAYVPTKALLFASTADALYIAAEKTFKHKILKMFPPIYLSDTEPYYLYKLTASKIQNIGKYESKTDSKSYGGYWQYDNKDGYFHWWKFNENSKQATKTDTVSKEILQRN